MASRRCCGTWMSRCRRAAWSVSWDATAWARRRCSRRSWGCCRPAEAVTFDGADITRWSPDRRARAGIGYVPQGREIFPHLTVAENLRMAYLGCGRESRLTDALDLFPALKPLLARKGGVLSGGEQQLLAIGRALLTRPKLLMLDEPTEGIQPSII